MSEHLERLLKNTVVVYSVEILNKIFLFAVFIFVARNFGVKLFGDYSYALTLYFFLQTIADFGFNMFLPRQMSRHDVDHNRLFHTAYYARIGLTVSMMAVAWVYFRITGDSAQIQSFVYITGGSIALSSYAINYSLTLRAMSLMKHDAVLRLSGTLVATFGSLAAVKLGGGMTGVAAAIAAGNIVMVWTALALNRRLALVKSTSAGWEDYRKTIKSALPFGAMAMMSLIYTRVDTIILQQLAGPEPVAYFNAAFRVVEALLIFPATISIVLMPMMSGFISRGENERAHELGRMSFKYMGQAGIFFCVITFALADKIIQVLYFSEQYAASVDVLRVFAFVIYILFICNVAGVMLLASRAASANVGIVALMVVMSLGLNLALIPVYGYIGAAVLRLGIEVTGLMLNMYFFNRMVFRLNYFEDALKPIAAGAALCAFIFAVKSLLFIPLYMAVYVLLLYILGAVSGKEFVFIKDMVAEKLLRS